ncbi:MAG TPA: ATP-binding cassette domain-containing protein [Acidimicrobiales bacterium]|nr:ATP-binding cassette domain-containing protein [Acidimicrobiales bacterium]
MAIAEGLGVEKIVVTYGGVRAVDGVSIDFRAGAVTGLIGPNGAGKTSLLNVIAGALRGAGGTVRLFGEDVSRLSSDARGRRGILRTFQTARTFERLSVVDNLIVAQPEQRGDRLLTALLRPRSWTAQERAARARALELLDLFGMTSHAEVRADQLSGGQRKIVDYLRALMANPKVLLLDEPSVGLAPGVLERLSQDLERMKGAGVCIVLVEHEMEFIRKSCDHVVAMANGSVVTQGSFETVAANDDVRAAYLGRR